MTYCRIAVNGIFAPVNAPTRGCMLGVVLDYTPESLQHHPGNGPSEMRRFGTNQYGEPLYRIVFAESRKHLVTGTWPDGSVGGKYRPRYRQAAGHWIMERWISADEYYKMPREKWDAMYPCLPFQDRGDYDLCHVFTCSIADANLDKLIVWIEAGRKSSFQDKRDACAAEYQQETKDTDNEMFARVNNSLPAFGATAMAGHGGARGTKTARIMKTANELRLPVGQNKFVQGKERKRYQVPIK